MKESARKRNELLGMNHSTAYHRLRKMVLWKYVVFVGDDVCYRCGERIGSIEELSIEHKESWLGSEDPLSSFFDLDNVAFSHLKCNSAAVSPELKSNGEKNGNSKLTEDDVHKIRRMLEYKTQAEIARYFGVAEPTISDIVHGKTWAWLKEETPLDIHPA